MFVCSKAYLLPPPSCTGRYDKSHYINSTNLISLIPFDHCHCNSVTPPASTAACNKNLEARRALCLIWGNAITRSVQFVKYQVLVSGYQTPVTRDSVRQAVWVLDRLIYLPEKTQQCCLVQATLALSTGDVRTGWLGRTSKPMCTSWGCLSSLQTQAADEAMTAKASGLTVAWHRSSL